MKNSLGLRVCCRVVLVPVLLMAVILPGIIQAEGPMEVGAVGAVARSPAQTIVSDDFNACELDRGLWDTVYSGFGSTVKVIGAFTGNAQLEIFTPDDMGSHEISANNTRAPRVLQSVDNTDFDIVAKFTSRMDKVYQIQGILVEGAGDHEFIRFEFHRAVGTYKAYAGVLANDILTPKHNDPVRDPAPGEDLYVRVVRQGDSFIHYHSYNGAIWFSHPAFTYPMVVEKVGVFAGNQAPPLGTVPKHTALVDYFFNKDAPIEDEDGGLNELNVEVLPATCTGCSVNKNPDKTSYACLDVVRLTPTAQQHWSFDGWSGPDAADMVDNGDGTWSITMNRAKDVTAVFSEDEYALTITTVGSGTVTQVPLPPYHYGDVVTLTPIPALGSSFTGWSGADAADLVDNGDGTWSVTMIEDKAVTATFGQGQYNVTVTIVGKGSVNHTPGNPYVYGEVATLEPIPATDPLTEWSFRGWSGPNAGELVDNGDGTWSMTMTGDKSVTATFGPDAFQVFVPMVLRNQ